jgi:hypothetical protein
MLQNVSQLREISELLDIKDRGGCPCGHTRDIVHRRLSEINGELARLPALKRDLIDIRSRLDTTEAQTDGQWWCETEFTKRGGDHS